ncbi:hypothetical protein PBCV1_a459R [Paramecium bursaria Chlorella virus 1]|uniref:Uncharacterized protein n=1 Tax=Paramecium bursaria Chlorella virus 1 TaxID=10506 RepID=Q98510_PBCV1|nr:hypothetical protein PBCV1_a459R [Paramecium bursaria Chlorella virus 1]AAC96827.1 hypothetical protein [Paramecium bursaria Chlorella virus 1]
MDWNSACSIAKSLLISGARTQYLSWKAEIPNFRSTLLERIPTSTVSKKFLITFRIIVDLPVAARPLKNGITCQESTWLTGYRILPSRANSQRCTSSSHCW